MDAEDEKQPVPFKVMKAALEAAELRAGMEGIDHRLEIVVAMRIAPQEGSETNPGGGVTSLSTIETDAHRQVLMEATQAFAKQMGYPLEMMVIDKTPQHG